MSSRAAEVAAQAGVRETRRRWLLSAPALLIVFFAAAGPLLVVLLYSFMVKGDYGDVKYWQFSLDGWFSVFLQRDIFDETHHHRRCACRDLLALGQAVDHDHRADADPRLPDRLLHLDAAGATGATCGCSSSRSRSGPTC